MIGCPMFQHVSRIFLALVDVVRFPKSTTAPLVAI